MRLRAASDMELQVVLVVLGLSAVAEGRCPNECSGHGTCLADADQCLCNRPYSGSDCSLTCPGTDDTVECSGHGTCLWRIRECLCDVPYSADDCSRTCPGTRDGVECSGHGICLMSEGRCSCLKPYSGDDCSVLSEPSWL